MDSSNGPIIDLNFRRKVQREGNALWFSKGLLILVFILFGPFLLGLVGCSDGGAASTESDEEVDDDVIITTTSTSGESNIASDSDSISLSNPLVLTYPLGVGLEVFAIPNGDILGQKAKHDESLNRLKGSAESCKPIILTDPPQLPANSCYDLDSDMIYRTLPSSVGTLNGVDEQGEACLFSAARANSLNVVHLIDQSLAVVQGMLCEAKKASLSELPSVGETFTFKLELEKALSGVAHSIEVATISRLENIGSRPRFRTDLIWKNQDGSNREVHMVHVPLDVHDNNRYHGTLWTRHTLHSEEAKTVPLDQYLSFQYAKVHEADRSRIEGRIRYARLIKSLGDLAFGSRGLLNLNVSTDTKGNYVEPETSQSFESPKNAVDSISFIEFDQDFQDGTGKLALWYDPEGLYNGHARGLVFESELNESGSFVACALAGTTAIDAVEHYLSIRKSIALDKKLELKGFYHPQLQTETLGSCLLDQSTLGSDVIGSYFKKTCGETAHQWYLPIGFNEEFIKRQRGSFITRQCTERDSLGKYILDASSYKLVDGDNLSENAIESPKTSNLFEISIQ